MYKDSQAKERVLIVLDLLEKTLKKYNYGIGVNKINGQLTFFDKEIYFKIGKLKGFKVNVEEFR